MIKKDINIEERDRYRPMMCMKQDFQEFMLDCEKTEKRDGIALKKEEDHNLEFIERQKQEVKQVRSILSMQKSDSATLDKVHAKV